MMRFWKLICPLCDGTGTLDSQAWDTEYWDEVCHACLYAGYLNLFYYLKWLALLSGRFQRLEYFINRLRKPRDISIRISK